MKTLLLAALTITAASLLSSCKTDPSSANGPNLPLSQSGGGGSTPAASPAVTYEGQVQVKSHGVEYQYNTLAVMNADGSNQTNVITAALPNTEESIRNGCWNYSGGSIAYRDYGSSSSTTYPSSIKTTNISVSNGVPDASTPSTIYTLNASDNATVTGIAWCSTSSTGKIAFTRQHSGGSDNGLSELCTISQTGGTPTVLASYKNVSSTGQVFSRYSYPTWSPDDSKIAVFQWDTTIGATTYLKIMIYNASTGAAVDSIPVSTYNVNGLEWSRPGTNSLAFSEIASSSGPTYIYFCTSTTGSTPTTNSVVGQATTWTPDNSSVMFIDPVSPFQLKTVPPGSSTTTTLSSDFVATDYSLNWKR